MAITRALIDALDKLPGRAKAVAGWDGSDVQFLSVTTDGKLPEVLYNGSTYQDKRAANVFKPHDGTAISTEATVWDPAAGKKFRLMGYHLVSSAAGNILLKDGNSGSTIAVVPSAAAGGGVYADLGEGILSSTADNNLRAIGPATATLSGTLWGTEE